MHMLQIAGLKIGDRTHLTFPTGSATLLLKFLLNKLLVSVFLIYLCNGFECASLSVCDFVIIESNQYD